MKRVGNNSQKKAISLDICLFTLEKNLITVSLVVNRSQLQHKLIHTRERPHDSGMCGKSFTVSRRDIQHKLIHTGERDNIAESLVVNRSQLQHQLIHTGPHSSRTCGKLFTVTT